MGDKFILILFFLGCCSKEPSNTLLEKNIPKKKKESSTIIENKIVEEIVTSNEETNTNDQKYYYQDKVEINGFCGTVQSYNKDTKEYKIYFYDVLDEEGDPGDEIIIRENVISLSNCWKERQDEIERAKTKEDIYLDNFQ